MKNYLIIFFFGCSILANFQLSAQMEIDGEILYGNEWINFDQEYFKLTVTEDGIYRVTGLELETAGLNLAEVQGRNLQLYHHGKQIPMFVSDADILEDDGFIEFYGKANRGEIDRHLYLDWEKDQLNPEYSNFTSDAIYFLTWETGSNNQDYRLSQIVNDISGNPTAEPYYLHEEKIVYTGRHNKPDHTVNNLRYSHFDKSEGFASSLEKSRTITFPISNKASASFKPKLNLRFGSNDTQHDLSVSVGSKQLFTELYNGNKLFQLNFELDDADLESQTPVTIIGNKGASDKYVTAIGEIVYAREFAFSPSTSISFIPRNINQDQYFEIDNFSSNSNLILVYDETTKSRLIANTATSAIRFKLPQSETENRKIFVYDYDDGVKRVNNIEKKSFTNYTDSNPSYVIVTSDKFDNAEIEAYADYRRSDIGGEFNTLIVHVEQLYDQYAYGINRNPISMRNFIQERKSAWSNLEYIFIIGKAIEYSNYRTEAQIQALEVPFYVPTWGVPGADNLLFSNKGLSAPIAAIGRIAARNEEDISNYLNKVFAHEQIANTEYSLESREWTKSILHLSGGNEEYDLDEQIYEKLGDMQEIIEASTFGGHVTTYRKTSADPLQTATSSEILRTIDDGKALITFFGHSGAGTFDFSLEDVSVWENYEKYPVILSMGCHSGNVHGENTELSLSEDFVLTPDRGALAFIASSSSATFTSLAVFGPNYYERFGNIFHNSAIAKAINAYLVEYNNIPEIGFKILNQQLTFHGDPAINLYQQTGPDYLVDIKSVSTDPEDINLSNQTYNVSFDIVNLGSYLETDIKLELSHYLPSGELARKYNKVVPAPAYRSTVTIPIVNAGLNALGKNRIDIHVDVDDAIAERPMPHAEENNILSLITEDEGYNYFVTGTTIIPVYPPEFGIVNDPDLTYVASGVNAFRPDSKYHIQLDTSELFEAPLLEEQFGLAGGTVKWNPTFDYQEDVVYYWRVTPIIDGEDDQWQTSSFIYLPEKGPGWNQSHFYQFLHNDLSNIDYEDRKLNYVDEEREVTLELFVSDGSGVTPNYINQVTILDRARLYNNMPSDGIAVLLRENKTLRWKDNPQPGLHGSWSNSLSNRIFFFRTDERQSRLDLLNFLENEVKDGEYVLLNTVINSKTESTLDLEEWAQDSTVNSAVNIFNYLESIGAKDIRALESGPKNYGLFYEKGGAVQAEGISETIDDKLNMSAIYYRDFTSGSLSSVLIGPSSGWGSAEKAVYPEINDTVQVNIIGIRPNGDETLLYELTTQNSVDLSEISHIDFPYMRFDYSSSDFVDRTPTDITFWRVYFKEAPEAIYESSKLLSFNSPALEQGEELVFDAEIANIVESSMDSLLVRYSIVNSSNNSLEKFERKEPLFGLSSNFLQFKQSTVDLEPGNYQFVAELNPLDDQLEQFHFNNYAITAFTIKRDRLNPLIDVKFNDVHIDNNEVISSDPKIEITLLDENPYLLLDDINSFQVVITHPDGTREDLDLVNDTRISFKPGTFDLNQAEITFLPEFLEEGVYEFYAQAKDRSGNFSGDVEYRVNFQILFENQITDVMICPNPLQPITDEIFFKFSLEGKILPSPFEIRIFSIDGQLVELIQTDRLGNVLIEGINLVPWDGTSMSGAPLASGTYFFKFGFIPDHRRNNLPELYFKDAFGAFVVINHE